MALFGIRNWDKPGPGIDKDAPKPRAFFQFFLLFGRKFWKYMGLNMLYILFSLPQIAVLYFVFLYHIAPLISSGLSNFSESELSWASNAIILSCVTVWIALCGTGPTSAGYVYILRNYSLEDHAWIWSDFRERIKENFLPGLVVFGIDILVLSVLRKHLRRIIGRILTSLFGILCLPLCDNALVHLPFDDRIPH